MEEKDVLEEENLTTETEEDDEFEYDEDGNIIIPDIESDDEDEEEESEEDEDEAPKEEPKPEEEDELARVKKELAALKKQSKDTLAKYGIEGDDLVKGLVSLAAGAVDKTDEEYLKDREVEEAKEFLKNQKWEELAKADLAKLHEEFPETKAYKHILDLPAEVRTKFAKFRDAGLTAEEAYAAANPKGIRAGAASAEAKTAMHESKSHIKSVVPKGSKDNSITMTKRELAEWRDLFPGMSDKEIQDLYRKTAN
jgi:hypothetical protein